MVESCEISLYVDDSYLSFLCFCHWDWNKIIADWFNDKHLTSCLLSGLKKTQYLDIVTGVHDFEIGHAELMQYLGLEFDILVKWCGKHG